MRLIPALAVLFVACGSPDVGIPDDWATEPIPQASLEVVSTTCGDARPSEWMTEALYIRNPDPLPGDPLFFMKFEDAPEHDCVAEEATDGTYPFVCDQEDPLRHWVNTAERDCLGYADVFVSGVFTGPRSASVDFVYDVNDCRCETSCAPFPAPCVFEARMTYADP